MAQVICFDIDGVLTEESDTDHRDLAGTYVYRGVRKRALELSLRAYNSGLYVLFFTGRREAHRRITEDWLVLHGFHYHSLVMGKPYFTWVIDDRVLGVSVDQQLDELERMLESHGQEADTVDAGGGPPETGGAEEGESFRKRIASFHTRGQESATT